MRTATKEKTDNGTEPQEKSLADYSPTELGAMCHQEHLIILRLQNELAAHQQTWNVINAEMQKRA